MHGLRLVLKGLRWRTGPSLAVFVVAVIATAASVLGPLYARSSEESLVRDRVAAAGTSTSLQLTAFLAGQTQQPVPALLGAVEKLADDSRYDAAYGPAALRMVVRDTGISTSGGYRANGEIGWHRGQCEAVRIVSGRCPQGRAEAMVSPGTAQAGNLHVGSPLTLAVGTKDGRDTVTVVGIYDPATAKPGIWGPESPVQAAAAGGAGGGPDTVDEVVVDRATLEASTAQVEVHALRPVRADRLHLADLPRLLAVANGSSTTGGNGGLGASAAPKVNVLAPLGGFLADLEPDRALVRGATFAVTAQLVLLAWFVLFLVVAAATEERSGEVALAKLRGMRAWPTAAFGLSEVVVLLVLALPVGAVLGWLAARVLGHALLEPGTALEPWRLPVMAATLLALLGGLAASALAARRILSAPVLDELRRAGGRRAALARSVAVDAIAVALAAAGLWNLRSGRSDSLALLAPGLIALACGLLAVRLLPLLFHSGVRATRGSSRVASFLAARNVTRRPGALRLVVLLTVAVALTVFAVDGWVIARTNREAVAAAQVGADRVLHVTTPSPRELLTAVRAVDPDGKQAMAAVQFESPNGGGVLAVDSRALPAVSAWQATWVGRSLPALAAQLHPQPTAPALPVTAPLTATVDLAWKAAPQGDTELYARLLDARGRVVDVDFGALRPGRQQLTAKVSECAATPCSLESWRAVRPSSVGVLPSEGTLTIRLADARGPVDLGSGRQWRPAVGARQISSGDLSGASQTAVQGGAVRLAFEPSGEDTVIAERADHPVALPVAVGSQTSLDSFAGNPRLAYGRTIDGSDAVLQPVGARGVIPRLGSNGELADLDYAAALSGGGLKASDAQVWLAPHATDSVVRALAAHGVGVTQVESLREVRAALDRDGTALSLWLYLVAALLSVALAGGAVLTAAYVSARRRSYELAALRMLGAPRRLLIGAGVREQLLLVGTGLALGLLTGLLAAKLTLPELPAIRGTAGDGPPPQFATAWLPVLGVVLAVLVVVGTLALLATRRTVRLAALDRLREAQA
ncbi:MAG: FtsX-like permease family protein [Actinomycetales bacterium]